MTVTDILTRCASFKHKATWYLVHLTYIRLPSKYMFIHDYQNQQQIRYLIKLTLVTVTMYVCISHCMVACSCGRRQYDFKINPSRNKLNAQFVPRQKVRATFRARHSVHRSNLEILNLR